MVKLDQAPTGKRVLKASTARAVRAMLETVISDYGTAKRAAVAGYRVCGKTGTVRKATSGGYSNKHLGVFAGMIPAETPRLVMVIMIDEPTAKEYYGGLVAAPVFSAVMNPAMRILNVPPDAIPSLDQQLHQSQSRIAKSGGHP
jgi:cell division protein FtsI (penicillin-binding protein 3)